MFLPLSVLMSDYTLENKLLENADVKDLPSSCETQLDLIVSVTAQLLFIPQQVQAENFFFVALPSYCGR